MKILVIGNDRQWEQCKLKLGADHELVLMTSYENVSKTLHDHKIAIDFLEAGKTHHLRVYSDFPEVTLLVNSVKTSLLSLKNQFAGLKNEWVGFNGLPGFFERRCWEITATGREAAVRLMNALHQDFELVDDRVGMVTPRIVCMIINEAYYTVQEGTASREDIDQAMKLGTNYPYGPFEWCRRMGVKQVYEVLDAVYQDTKDERYKICPLLRKEYLSALAAAG